MWVNANTDAPSQEVLHIQTKYDIFKIRRGSLFPGARYCIMISTGHRVFQVHAYITCNCAIWLAAQPDGLLAHEWSYMSKILRRCA